MEERCPWLIELWGSVAIKAWAQRLDPRRRRPAGGAGWVWFAACLKKLPVKKIKVRMGRCRGRGRNVNY